MTLLPKAQRMLFSSPMLCWEKQSLSMYLALPKKTFRLKENRNQYNASTQIDKIYCFSPICGRWVNKMRANWRPFREILFFQMVRSGWTKKPHKPSPPLKAKGFTSMAYQHWITKQQALASFEGSHIRLGGISTDVIPIQNCFQKIQRYCLGDKYSALKGCPPQRSTNLLFHHAKHNYL